MGMGDITEALRPLSLIGLLSIAPLAGADGCDRNDSVGDEIEDAADEVGDGIEDATE